MLAPMSARDLLSIAAREPVSRAVRDVESATAAEIVVVVRREAGQYLHVDLLVGCGGGLAMLLFVLFAPPEFPLWSIPLGVVAAFVLGVLVSRVAAPLRRALSRAHAANAELAARAAFVERGVHHTRARTGVLVHVAVFERAVTLVCDAGISDEAQVRARAAFATFPETAGDLAAALRKAGAALSKAHPRADGDVNELADEVAA
jgi:putative membrane protein